MDNSVTQYNVARMEVVYVMMCCANVVLRGAGVFYRNDGESFHKSLMGVNCA
jgi:hypothetical protein